jgi:hypothetical protein
MRGSSSLPFLIRRTRAVIPTAIEVATSDSAVEKRKSPKKLVGM